MAMTSLKRNGRSHQGKPVRTRLLIYNPAMRRLFLLALVLATPLLAQNQDFSKVEVKAAKVAGSVYMLTGSGGNIGVSVGDDGIVIVDDQFAPLAPKIKE